MNPQGTAELSGAERINAERARQIDSEDYADDGCQGETCVCDHDHSTDLPICKTREILDA